MTSLTSRSLRFDVSRVKLIGPSDGTSCRPYRMTSHPVGFLDELISGRPCWMTQHPVGHLGMMTKRVAFYEMRSPYFLLTPPQLKNGGKICTSTFTLSLEKRRENLGSPLLLLSGNFPGVEVFAIPQNQQNDMCPQRRLRSA